MSFLPFSIIDPNQELPLQQGISLQEFTVDVFGEKLCKETCSMPSWGLALSKDSLFLAFCWQEQVLPHPAEKAEFVEGLWEYDCGELFLSNPENGRYLELNLSPKGAWWSCLFDAPLQRFEENPKPIIGAYVSVYELKNLTVLRLPLAKIRVALGLEATPQAKIHANVTACLREPQRFLSAIPLGGEQPDFHRPQDFLPLQSD